MVNALPASQSLQVAGFGCIRNGRVLLRDIDLEVQSGQILLLQGGNGTGKSTLLRSLAGLMSWRAGELIWCGRQVTARHPEFQLQLAYLGHQCAMSDALSGMENLRFALQMQGVCWSAKQVVPVLEQLGLADLMQRPVARLSQGQRRRLALARVMLSGRSVWLLDEPDNALDAQACIWLADLLAAHAQAGGLSIVVSHRGITVPNTPTRVLDLSAQAPQMRVLEAAA